MRTYGRVTDKLTGKKTWVVETTNPVAGDSLVWVTTLCQVLLLNLGESPFYANYGIPAKPSVVQQLFPDFFVSRTQQQFAQYFASLIVTKLPSRTPTYRVDIVTQQGTKINAQVAV
jgi:hypothetical protein